MSRFHRDEEVTLTCVYRILTSDSSLRDPEVDRASERENEPEYDPSSDEPPATLRVVYVRRPSEAA